MRPLYGNFAVIRTAPHEDGKGSSYGKSSRPAREFWEKAAAFGRDSADGEVGQEVRDLAAEPVGLGLELARLALDAGGNVTRHRRRTGDLAHAVEDLLRAAGGTLSTARDLCGGRLLLLDRGGDRRREAVDVLDLADDLLQRLDRA